MENFVVGNQYDGEGKIVDKLVTITKQITQKIMASETELKYRKKSIIANQSALANELADIEVMLKACEDSRKEV